jgi:hypothetical protein
MTTSKLLSANGSASASASTHSSSTFAICRDHPTGVGQFWREIARGDDGADRSTGNGRVTGAYSDAEDAMAGTDSARSNQLGSQLGAELGGDRRVVTRRP